MALGVQLAASHPQHALFFPCPAVRFELDEPFLSASKLPANVGCGKTVGMAPFAAKRAVSRASEAVFYFYPPHLSLIHI